MSAASEVPGVRNKALLRHAQPTEFRADGWPLCPQCENDEVYSSLLLGWTESRVPTMNEIADGHFGCYACSWEVDCLLTRRISVA